MQGLIAGLILLAAGLLTIWWVGTIGQKPPVLVGSVGAGPNLPAKAYLIDEEGYIVAMEKLELVPTGRGTYADTAVDFRNILRGGRMAAVAIATPLGGNMAIIHPTRVVYEMETAHVDIGWAYDAFKQLEAIP